MENLRFLPLGHNDIKTLLEQDKQMVYDMFMSHAAYVKTLNVKEMQFIRRSTLGQILYRDQRFTGNDHKKINGFFTVEQLKNLRREFFPAALHLDLSKDMVDVYRKADAEVLFNFLVDCAGVLKSQKIQEIPKGFRIHLGRILTQLKYRFKGQNEKDKLTEVFFPVALSLDLSDVAIINYKNAKPVPLWHFLMDCLDEIKAGRDRRERELQELIGKNREAAEREAKSWHGRMTKIGFVLFERGTPVEEIINQLDVEMQKKLEANYLATYHNFGQKAEELVGRRESMRWQKNRSTVNESETSELKSIGANAKIIPAKVKAPVSQPVKKSKPRSGKKVEKK